MEEDETTLIAKKGFPLHWEVLLLALLVAGLHYVAEIFYLYWTIEWFDILMHFLGGFLIALFAMYILSRIGWFKNEKQYTLICILFTLAITLIIGLSWELWELFVGFSDQITDLMDTITDIVMDLTGAITAYVYNRKKI